MHDSRTNSRQILPRSRTAGMWVIAALLIALSAAWGPASQWRFVVEEPASRDAGSSAMSVRCEFTAASEAASIKSGSKSKIPVTRHVSSFNSHTEAPVSVGLSSLQASSWQFHSYDASEVVSFKPSVLDGLYAQGPPGLPDFDVSALPSSLLLAVPVTRGPPA